MKEERLFCHKNIKSIYKAFGNWLLAFGKAAGTTNKYSIQ